MEKCFLRNWCFRLSLYPFFQSTHAIIGDCVDVTIGRTILLLDFFRDPGIVV